MHFSSLFDPIVRWIFLWLVHKSRGGGSCSKIGIILEIIHAHLDEEDENLHQNQIDVTISQ